MDLIPHSWQPINANSLKNTTDGENEELFQGYSSELLTFASTACIIFVIIGLPGNLITIIALARCKKVHNATTIFIMNLSLSDLLFCCFNLPLAASTFARRAWIHGRALCKVFPLMRYGLLAVSLFTVLAITINRYVMIGHPRIYPRIYRRRYLVIMVALTWLCAFCALIPTWEGIWGEFGLDLRVGSCTILPSQNGRSPKQFLFIMAFVVPCLSIVVCYARIFYIVRKTAMRTQDPIGFKASSQPNIVIAVTKDERMNLTNSNQQLADNTLLYEIKKSNSTGSFQPSINSNECLHSIQPKIGNRLHREVREGTPLGFHHQNDEDIKFIDTSRENSDLTSSVSSFKPNTFYGTTQNTNNILNVDEEAQQNVSNIDISKENDDPKNSNEANNQQLSREGKFKKSVKKPTTGSRARRRVRKSSTVHASGASLLYPGRMSPKDRRLLKMILVIFLSFLICYLPITITKIVKSVTEIHMFNIMGYLLIYLTTIINPIIYVVMSSEYRQAYWNMLMCRTGSNQNINAKNNNGRKDKEIKHRFWNIFRL